MKRFMICILLLSIFLSVTTTVAAASAQAYQDYLFQFDTYRASYNEFSIAKNEYQKFGTLTSEAVALEKTKDMMSKRDSMLRSYLLLLTEKLNESMIISVVDRQTYQTILNREIAFLDAHLPLIPAVNSLTDATSVSKQLEGHYTVLSASMRQIIIALKLGELGSKGAEFDTMVLHLQTFVNEHRSEISPSRQAIIDRWFGQITNKRSLFQEKVNTIKSAIPTLSATYETELDRKFVELQTSITEAQQYLIEGSSYSRELLTALKYKE